MNRKAQTHKRMRKKRTAIPVQPPKVPFGTYVSPPEIPIMYQKMKSEPKKLSTLEKGNYIPATHLSPKKEKKLIFTLFRTNSILFTLKATKCMVTYKKKSQA